MMKPKEQHEEQNYGQEPEGDSYEHHPADCRMEVEMGASDERPDQQTNTLMRERTP